MAVRCHNSGRSQYLVILERALEGAAIAVDHCRLAVELSSLPRAIVSNDRARGGGEDALSVKQALLP